METTARKNNIPVKHILWRTWNHLIHHSLVTSDRKFSMIGLLTQQMFP